MPTKEMLLAPTAELARRISEELGETYPGKMDQCVQELKQWMQSQPHLPRNYDERVLPRMIFGTKFNLNRTKKKIDAYFTARAKHPDLFTQRDPFSPEIQQAMKALTVLPLPQCRSDGTRVTLHIVNDVDSSEFVPQNVYKLLLMLGDIRLVEEPQIAGDVYVFDLNRVSLGVAVRFAGPLLKRALLIAQNAYPQRLQEIHILNAPGYIGKPLALFRSFMKEKMRNRFVIHDSMSSLYKYVPEELLPSEYGGDRKTIHQLKDQWTKALESYASYFIQQEGVKADESRRSSDDLESGRNSTSKRSKAPPKEVLVQSSFRRLDLD